MTETRAADAMPTTGWTVIDFSAEKGRGTLRHSGGEEVPFDIEVWNLGDWAPAIYDSTLGASSPLLPRPGEPARVEWKRSLSGKNVPRLVQPVGRESRTAPRYTLKAWLDGIRKRTGRFSKLTPKGLVKALEDRDMDGDEWADGEERAAPDFAFLLMTIANLASDDAAFRAAHADWIYSDDHRWDRDSAAERLPAMLGLAPGSVATAGDGRSAGGDQSLSEYASACNERAAAQGLPLRLHEIALDADAHVLVCLPPQAFDALVEGGYVARAE